MAEAPLNYEASAGTTNLQVSDSLPSEVVQCLQNARFLCRKHANAQQQLHLATCTSNHPHVSLMNYTYLPSTPWSPHPTIVMTTNPSSKKTQNLLANPHVSLLVHDWVSHRPPTSNRATSPPRQSGTRSSLAEILIGLNTSAISSISATINGEARIVEQGGEEELWLRGKHLENCVFMAEEGEERGEGDGGRVFVEGEEVNVVSVRVGDGRVSDWKGGVRDWVLRGAEGENGGQTPMVNGVGH
ncbi:pyridoxamine 5 -phosphate oxidase protein [Rutstroemia sp. NJR-2017a WRK4]|nr:pyridoxamine 5 -phosphate oxidase protein [Rutstroemia sp. NJR-2017a WRK4]